MTLNVNNVTMLMLMMMTDSDIASKFKAAIRIHYSIQP